MGLFNKVYKRTSGVDTFYKRGAIAKQDGLTTKKVAVATFNPTGDTSQRTIAAHGLGVYLPDNAVITNAWVDVITTFTSATDAATIALKVQSANDLVSAIAISDVSNVWDAGIHGCLPGSPVLGVEASHDTAIELAALQAASMVKTTAEREITATVAVEALTAGKAVIYVEYVISD